MFSGMLLCRSSFAQRTPDGICLVWFKAASSITGRDGMDRFSVKSRLPVSSCESHVVGAQTQTGDPFDWLRPRYGARVGPAFWNDDVTTPSRKSTAQT